jgi:hypothetical protein
MLRFVCVGRCPLMAVELYRCIAARFTSRRVCRLGSQTCCLQLESLFCLYAKSWLFLMMVLAVPSESSNSRVGRRPRVSRFCFVAPTLTGLAIVLDRPTRGTGEQPWYRVGSDVTGDVS